MYMCVDLIYICTQMRGIICMDTLEQAARSCNTCWQALLGTPEVEYFRSSITRQFVVRAELRHCRRALASSLSSSSE